MTYSFSVSEQDIPELRDDDLRELIGLLCGAELNANGYSDAAVRYDGHQDAADGGVDVNVEAETLGYDNGYIPKAATHFQVKVPKMTDGEIVKEMRPGGILLPAIAALAATDGAYIIVSSKANYTFSKREARIATMREALNGLPVKVDYYGQKQVAKWVNQYPALVSWVKEKLGQPLQGWQPFGNWAQVPVAAQGSYLTDDGLVLRPTTSSDKRWTGVEAVEHVRKLLREAETSVRLIGLSGVGKTRFAQALFEDGVGGPPLAKTSVFYTNSKVQQTPNPGDLLTALQGSQQADLVVIDNCSSAMHRELTDLLKSANGQVSLLTIEYDIREGDLPEGSTALKLEPGSEELVKKVLKRLFPQLAWVAHQRIASLAGGNFRVAKAIGERIVAGEDVSGLGDEELFNRIFFQGKTLDKDLLAVAELLSLVYSFDQRQETEEPELKVLADLEGIPLRTLQRSVRELVARDVVQERGHWGALLPPAIANRLAGRALKQYGTAELNACFLAPGRRRMLKSFANRLGYLPESKEAKAIAVSWLALGGLLADLEAYDRDLFAILGDVAIVAEEKTLELIEGWARSQVQRDVVKSKYGLSSVLRMVKYLGYRPEFFERAVLVLMVWYEAEDIENDKRNHRDSIARFFQLYLSGTQATPVTRAEVLVRLIDRCGEDLKMVNELLGSALRFDNFRGHPHYSESKSRPDYGYRPKTRDEVVAWYQLHLGVLGELIDRGDALGDIATDVFNTIFAKVYLEDFLRYQALQLVEVLERKGGWQEGWLTISGTMARYDESLPEERRKELQSLLARYEPLSLWERIETYVLFERGGDWQVMRWLETEGCVDGYEALREKGRALGEESVGQADVLLKTFQALLARLDFYGGHRFGEAVGCRIDKVDLLNLLKSLFNDLSPEDVVDYGSIQGLFQGLYVSRREMCHEVLDVVLADKFLRHHFLPLQLSHPQDERDIERLEGVIGASFIDRRHYRFLNGWVKKIPEKKLVSILRGIQAETGEWVDVLSALFYRFDKAETNLIVSDNMMQLILDCLGNHPFIIRREGHQRREYVHKRSIIKDLFHDQRTRSVSISILENLRKNLAGRWSMPYEAKTLIEAIAEHHPEAVLDVFVTGVEVGRYWDDGNAIPDQLRPLITGLPLAAVRDWVTGDKESRCRDLSYCISPFVDRDRSAIATNWLALAELVLSGVMKQETLSWFHASFRSRSAVGNDAASAMELCLPLVESLAQHNSLEVREWARLETEALGKDIEAAKAEEGSFWGGEEADPRFE